MFKSLVVTLTLLVGILITSPVSAFCDTLFSFFSINDCCGCSSSCCQNLELDLGWRRDQLDWKLSDLNSDYVSGSVDDHILFKDINSYTVSAQAKWFSSYYYIRVSGEYGSTEKGRAHEHFHIESPYFYYPITVHTSDPIKRRSEMYDLNIAAGYPLAFFDCRLSVVPLVGFSFHRQHLRVKLPDESSSDSYVRARSSSRFFREHSSSSFFVSSDNPFIGFIFDII